MPMPLRTGSLLAVAVLATAALWLALHRDYGAAPSAPPPRAAQTRADAPAVTPRSAPTARVGAAAERVRELRALSETFRNTTFLIAIRETGYLCSELLDVYGGVNDSYTWTVTCAEMLAYTVSVADDGALTIDPMLHHLDGMPPRPIDRDRVRPAPAPLEPLR